MSAAMDTTAPLEKVDSAIAGLSSSPKDEKKIGHRRTSSSVSGVYNVNDLGKSFSHASLQCVFTRDDEDKDLTIQQRRKARS